MRDGVDDDVGTGTEADDSDQRQRDQRRLPEALGQGTDPVGEGGQGRIRLSRAQGERAAAAKPPGEVKNRTSGVTTNVTGFWTASACRRAASSVARVALLLGLPASWPDDPRVSPESRQRCRSYRLGDISMRRNLPRHHRRRCALRSLTPPRWGQTRLRWIRLSAWSRARSCRPRQGPRPAATSPAPAAEKRPVRR